MREANVCRGQQRVQGEQQFIQQRPLNTVEENRTQLNSALFIDYHQDQPEFASFSNIYLFLFYVYECITESM